MQTRKIPVQAAVGRVIPHDITRIIPGKFKGVAFKKGHIIREEDIPELLRLGKENIYVLDLEAGEVHEDEAGLRLGKAAAGEGVTCSGPRESRVNLLAARAGLLKINIPALEAINDLPEVVLATLPDNTPVAAGEMLAGTKVIPLVVKEGVIRKAERITARLGKVVRVLPYRKLQVGIIVTGSEVYTGRIQDAFGPVLKEKVESFGSEVRELRYAPDDSRVIALLIQELLEGGAGLVLVSGGMSVDPDDVTPQGIALSGARIEKYGAPVLPGAMFLLAYKGSIPVIGMPACGMYFRTTILDLVLPRLLVGEHLTRRDLVAFGHGGLCRSCPECYYPRCGLGLAGSGKE